MNRIYIQQLNYISCDTINAIFDSFLMQRNVLDLKNQIKYAWDDGSDEHDT